MSPAQRRGPGSLGVQASGLLGSGWHPCFLTTSLTHSPLSSVRAAIGDTVVQASPWPRTAPNCSSQNEVQMLLAWGAAHLPAQTGISLLVAQAVPAPLLPCSHLCLQPTVSSLLAGNAQTLWSKPLPGASWAAAPCASPPGSRCRGAPTSQPRACSHATGL